jgi:hypothetical protein
MLNATKTKVAPRRANVLLKRFVARTITPFVLIAGLLVLIVFHFHSALQTSQNEFGAVRGTQTYSAGDLQAAFHLNSGDGRPSIISQNGEMLSWVDGSSTFSVDGQPFGLWDTAHNYDTDDGRRQVYSTSTGHGCQVIEIVTLVNDHTVTVEYRVVAQPVTKFSGPRRVTLNIAHYHQGLDTPVVNGNTLTSGVLPVDPFNPTLPETTLTPFAKITLSVGGPHVDANPVRLMDYHLDQVGGGTHAYANSFTTSYSIDNPAVNEIVPLGTETFTFQRVG